MVTQVEFDERFEETTIESQIASLGFHRDIGYRVACMKRPDVIRRDIHVVMEFSATISKLAKFLEAHEDCTTFGDFHKNDPEGYEWVKEQILNYCDEFLYCC